MKYIGTARSSFIFIQSNLVTTVACFTVNAMPWIYQISNDLHNKHSRIHYRNLPGLYQVHNPFFGLTWCIMVIYVAIIVFEILQSLVENDGYAPLREDYEFI